MKRIILVIGFILAHIIYDVMGVRESSFWAIYYLSLPYIFAIAITMSEINPNMSKLWKWYSFGLIGILLFYLLRYCSFYDPEYFKFTTCFKEFPLYYVPIIYIFLALIIYVKYKFSKK